METATTPQMTYPQFTQLVSVIQSHCPDQAIGEDVADSWYDVLAPNCTYEQAVNAISTIVLSDRFAKMTVHKIVPVDILTTLRSTRQKAGRYYATPDPDDPAIADDPARYIAHQALARQQAVEGKLPNTNGLPVSALGRAQRRRRALAQGAPPVDRTNPDQLRADVASPVRAQIDQVRAQLGSGAPLRKPVAPLATDPANIPRLGAATQRFAKEKFPDRATPTAPTGHPEDDTQWCQRCNRDTGVRSAVTPQGQVRHVPCWECPPPQARTRGAA